MARESKTLEINFDGLVGPSHNYSGLSSGNIASTGHGGKVSNPKQAALQGLQKARYLLQRGFQQGIVLPQERPNLQFLRSHGYSGRDSQVVEKVYKNNPRLLSVAFSASSMWTANAATVVPSTDAADKKLHIVIANLFAKAHRAQEAEWTQRYFKRIFAHESFEVHPALSGGDPYADEGAANHTRLTGSPHSPGVHLFVYGRSHWQKLATPKKFVARQTLEASESVARLAEVSPRAFFLQQNPTAIDAGVFHNDVISVGNENVFFSHEAAFTAPGRKQLRAFFKKYYPRSLGSK